MQRELGTEIVRLRRLLVKAVELEGGFISESVILLSQKLDNLIVRYMQTHPVTMDKSENIL